MMKFNKLAFYMAGTLFVTGISSHVWADASSHKPAHQHDEHEGHGNNHEEHGHGHANEASNKNQEDDGHDHKESDENSKKHDEHEGHSHDHGEHGHSNEKDSDEHESSGVGPDKAILKAEAHGKRLQLSAAAIKTMGIQGNDVSAITESGVYEIPVSALVKHQDKYAIFVRDGQWFEQVSVNYLSKAASDKAKIQSNQLSGSKTIVTEGAAYLRLAFLEASGKGGEGHAH